MGSFNGDSGGRESFGTLGRLLERDDDADFDPIPRGVRFNEAGTVVIIPVDNGDHTVDSTQALTINVAAGETPPWHIRRVLEAGSDDIAFHAVD